MEISLRSAKLAKQSQAGRKLTALRGDRRARLIMRRIQELRAAQNLGDLWPPYSGPSRFHELTGNRAGQLSLDLDHPYRLIFEPAHEPSTQRPEGGLDWPRVTSVRILGVEDTHDQH